MDSDITNILEANKHVGQILTSFGEFGGLGVFVGTLMFGEVAIFVSFLFAEQGKIGFAEVFLFSFFAVWCADAFWLLVGRYFPKSHTPTFLKSPVLAQANQIIKKLTKNRLMLSLIAFQFFIGARIAYMLYLGQQGVRLSVVFVYNIAAVFFLVLALSVLGRVSGQYIESAFSSYQYVASILFGLLFLLAILILTRVLLKKDTATK